MNTKLNVGVIGCGYWGPNLIRNFNQMPRTSVKRIADLDENRLQHLQQLYQNIETTIDYQTILSDPEIDIIAIATPVIAHFRFASEALAAGKHVFVEKPMVTSMSDANELISLADKVQCKLMVGHTFIYSPAVREMKQIVDSGDLGDVYYINCQRLNLGPIRHDINVIWDLAPHDFSIILHLLGKDAEAVSAIGSAYINPMIEDVATVTLYFDNNVIAFVQCSWLDPDKIRRMAFVGRKKMMVYDDIQPSEKIRIYDKSVDKPTYYDTFSEFHYSYKYGDIIIPRIESGEPIRNELDHFVDCIINDETPLSDGKAGRQIVQILEATQQSLAENGKKIYL